MVVSVHRNRQDILAQQLFGHVCEAMIVGQTGDEGGLLLHERGVVAALAVVLAAFNPEVQTGIELTAILRHLLR